MKTAGKPNSLLIEMIIVLLFFAISAAVVLQLFVAAHNASTQSNVDNAATLLVEDLSSRFSQSGDSAEQFFQADGWTRTEDGYAQTTMVSGRSLRLAAQGEQTMTDAGVLDDYLIIVYDGEREVIQMPVARYVPGEDGR